MRSKAVQVGMVQNSKLRQFILSACEMSESGRMTIEQFNVFSFGQTLENCHDNGSSVSIS